MNPALLENVCDKFFLLQLPPFICVFDFFFCSMIIMCSRENTQIGIV